MRHKPRRKRTAGTDCTKRIRVEKLSLPTLQKLFETRMQEDLPEAELKLFPEMQKLYETGHYLSLTIRDNSESHDPLAYVLFAREKAEEGHRYLLNYFAVKELECGSGIRTDFSREMEAHIDNAETILGEIENPDHVTDDEEEAARLRRRAFYLRDSVCETRVRAEVCDVSYCILEAGGTTSHSAIETQHVLDRLYCRFFPERMHRGEVSVRIA